jgi:hypothetical protein
MYAQFSVHVTLFVTQYIKFCRIDGGNQINTKKSTILLNIFAVYAPEWYQPFWSIGYNPKWGISAIDTKLK